MHTKYTWRRRDCGLSSRLRHLETEKCDPYDTIHMFLLNRVLNDQVLRRHSLPLFSTQSGPTKLTAVIEWGYCCEEKGKWWSPTLNQLSQPGAPLSFFLITILSIFKKLFNYFIRVCLTWKVVHVYYIQLNEFRYKHAPVKPYKHM